MKISDVVCSVGLSGYFNWDLAALKAGAKADGFVFSGAPITPGFRRIIEPGESISVMLVLDDGQVAFGDCMDVILTGVAGRDRRFRAAAHLGILEETVRERLIGVDITRFSERAVEVDGLRVDGLS